MDLRIDFFTLIASMGALQALILAVFLFRFNPATTPQNRVLACLLVVFSIACSGAIIYYSNLIYRLPWLARVHSPFAFLIGPLMYLYIRMMLDHSYHLRRIDYLHFAPAVIAGMLLAPVYIMPASEKLLYLQRQFAYDSPGFVLFYAAIQASGLAYLSLIIVSLIRSYKTEKQHKTARYYGVRKWLFIFAAFFAALMLASSLRIYTGISSDNTHWIPIIFALMIYYMSYEALRQPFIFGPRRQATYAGTSDQEQDLAAILDLVSAHIREHEVYLKDGMTIGALAKRTGLPVNHLSRAINELTQSNYSDFMNKFRVQKACELLRDAQYKHYSVAGIGSECGFNSKASYYGAFKRFKNMTPNQFRSSKLVQDANAEPPAAEI